MRLLDLLKKGREALRRTADIAVVLLFILAALLVVCHLHAPEGAAAWRYPEPGKVSRTPSATAEPLSGSVSVNTAALDELTTLPGVGPSLAESILYERERNGLFYYPEDLLCVRGIGEKTLEKLLPYLNLD
jgi:competence ComEA-like helix-hairpin-helix protein